MHESAYNDAQKFRDKYLDQSKPLTVADVGSFDVNGCLKPLFAASTLWSYTGFDIVDGPNVDVVVDREYGWSTDFENQFDVVVATQVMEHVRRPWEWIKDVIAICRPSGLIYICTPNTLGFHEYPIDCWRAWPDGLRALMEDYVTVLECYAADIDTTGIGKK